MGLACLRRARGPRGRPRLPLGGDTRRDSRSVDRENLVTDASLGAALVMPRARPTATDTIRSREFTTQRGAAQFGSLSLAFRF